MIKKIIILVILLIFPRISEATDFTVDPNCVAGWKLEGSSGTDECNANNISHAVDVTTGGAGKYGNDVSYSGASDSDSTITDFDELSRSSDHTIAFWINPDDVTSYSKTILSQSLLSSDRLGILLEDGEIRVSHYNGSSFESISGGSLTVGVYSHVCAVWDTATKAWETALVDGVSISGTNNASTGGAGTQMKIGGRHDTDGQNISADIDEIILFSDKLSSSECIDLMNHGMDGTENPANAQSSFKLRKVNFKGDVSIR